MGILKFMGGLPALMAMIERHGEREREETLKIGNSGAVFVELERIIGVVGPR